MKRILIGILTSIMLMALTVPAVAGVAILDNVSDEAFAALDQTTVIRDENSATGYIVTFRYAAPDAKRVRIRGEWNFSDPYHSSTSGAISIAPEDWVVGNFPVQNPEWPAFDLEKNEDTGIWSYTIPLPSGTWSYRFIVDGVEGAALTDYTDAFVETDPNNRPLEKVLGEQNNSQVYVPFDANKQVKDNAIQAPRQDDQKGTVVNLIYEPIGVPAESIQDTAAIAAYLPYGYDAEREEPYKVLYLSHGSGLESEYSWFNKGALANIMDNLIAEGRCEPFVVVSVNSYATSFNDENVIDNIVPLAEANFNISREPAGRAMSGLSGGARLTLRLAAKYPGFFGYYCPMAGELEGLSFDGEKLADAKFHITMGLYEARMDKLTEMEVALKEAGLGYTQALYVGGHDWFVWRDVLVDYATDLLWK